MVEEEIRMCSIGGVTLTKPNFSIQRENQSQYHTSITDATVIVLGSNLDLCDEKVATDYLNYGMALSCGEIF
jgi:hypothetical protein